MVIGLELGVLTDLMPRTSALAFYIGLELYSRQSNKKGLARYERTVSAAFEKNLERIGGEGSIGRSSDDHRTSGRGTGQIRRDEGELNPLLALFERGEESSFFGFLTLVESIKEALDALPSDRIDKLLINECHFLAFTDEIHTRAHGLAQGKRSWHDVIRGTNPL